MLEIPNLILIISAALVATGSPGPATLKIASTSMHYGWRAGLMTAAGVTTGSLMWSISAACGMAAIMLSNSWTLEIIRYLGAAYLLYLAIQSAKSALLPGPKHRDALSDQPRNSEEFNQTKHSKATRDTAKSMYFSGLALHLTNPKAILFFGSLYGVALPASTNTETLAFVVILVGTISTCIFHGYALLFSRPPVMRAYLRYRRWFEGAFAVIFGIAGLKILTARLQ
ncbi:MAG: LysE family translocator [Pseudomonadota bacterium]